MLVGRWVGRRVWRLIHFAAYPVFGLGLFHGLAISRGFGPGAAVDPFDPRKVLLGLAAAVVILSAFIRVAVAVRKRYGGARMR